MAMNMTFPESLLWQGRASRGYWITTARKAATSLPLRKKLAAVAIAGQFPVRRSRPLRWRAISPSNDKVDRRASVITPSCALRTRLKAEKLSSLESYLNAVRNSSIVKI
ncbi:hypothetical protein HO173_005634 [Letharia columbiana]|uniref:Uncharacterized protein n=1 Tax=Letharia columbiana TaxID=112416 RepID=A0A8H6FWB3_9LECA|nr:uncharacterized protein HO173_005634 [Letharia columbiana]KAF6236006.1 hypothetical protein HO173_005634 [Letharia columbiana]